MVAEVVRVLRVLKQPFRADYWRSRLPNKRLDQPGVLLISFAQLTDSERKRLQKMFPDYQDHPLLDESLPPLPTDEHLEPDTLWLSWTRIFSFFAQSLRNLLPLLTGTRNLPRHLLETDDLVRVRYGLEQGRGFLHISSLQFRVVTKTHKLKRFIRDLETRRYEIWLVDRQAKKCYLPASLVLPDVPISSREVVELGQGYLCPSSRAGTVKKHMKIDGCFRIMSYNLHSCIGLDGRTSVQRIADVLHRYQPDFVALQEVDVGCSRSGHCDQIEELKKLWPCYGEFFPILPMSGGSYGIGFLSKLPVESWEGTILPMPTQTFPQEPRAVLQVEVLPSGCTKSIRILNTHLGLTRKERLSQLHGISDLLQADDKEGQILIGDFNCSPKSFEYRKILEHWTPTQDKPAKTWFGTFPLRHLDYCFFRGPLEVEACWVPRDSRTRVASDHLPVIVDFRW